MRLLVIFLCAALMAPALLGPAEGAEGKPRAKKQRAAAAAKADEKPRISQAELAAPFSALNREALGPAQAEERKGGERPDLRDSYQSNATSWKLDLSLDPKPRDDSPLRFRVGRETVLDPITGKELTPRADPLGAKERLKELDLKGAAEKLGGKAEVQVDVLKF